MTTRQIGERLLFELPFGGEPPHLLNPDLGIARITALASGSYTIDVTIIDTPDARLLRAGVVLAHRVSDGVGEWYLSAPGWSILPQEAVRPVDASAELPTEFAALLRPFHRFGLIGPFAALSCARTEFKLRDSEGRALCEVIDDQVTLSRGGEVVRQYREATLYPAMELTQAQRDFILAAMRSGSAHQVHEFPRLQTRLGAPATGLTDFPEPRDPGRRATLTEFVQYCLTSRLQDIMVAYLTLVQGGTGTPGLGAVLQRTARDIRGLAPVLEPGWREQLENCLGGIGLVGDEVFDTVPRSRELIDVVDALVSAARAPKVGDFGEREAAPLFFDRISSGTRILVDRCMSLRVDAPNRNWDAAMLAAEQLQMTSDVACELHGSWSRRFLKRLRVLVSQLRACTVVVEVPDDVSGMTPEEAFTTGYVVAQQQAELNLAKREFVSEWPGQLAGLRKLVRQV